MNSLESLGFSRFFSEQYDQLGREGYAPARISHESRGHYGLLGCRASLGELSGRLRHDLGSRDKPVVGDWVAVADGDDRAVIHHIFDRRTVLARRAAGSKTDAQIIAANVDLFFIVTSANRDFNLRRLERYMAAVWDGGADPVVVLNKIDVADNIEDLIDGIDAVAQGIPVLPASALTGAGVEALRAHVREGETAGFVGSSGVGKSSLINRLLGSDVQEIGKLRRDEKGRHATTRRELIELPGGGMLVDTPGMREFGLIDDAGGVDAIFADIVEIAEMCRFRDCRHDGEPGCAVAEAVEDGALDPSRLASYHKLQREIAAAQRRRDPIEGSRSKRRWKEISKSIRTHYKHHPKNRR